MTKVNAKKGNGQIESLVLVNLAASVESLTAQAVALTDPAYIAAQPDYALALLHGTLADRALRLLSVLPRGSVPTCPI